MVISADPQIPLVTTVYAQHIILTTQMHGTSTAIPNPIHLFLSSAVSRAFKHILFTARSRSHFSGAIAMMASPIDLSHEW